MHVRTGLRSFFGHRRTFVKSLSGKGQDICAVIDASYLRIYLFLLIINLDYSRHLKRGNNNSEAAGGKKRVHSTVRLHNNRAGVCLWPTVLIPKRRSLLEWKSTASQV